MTVDISPHSHRLTCGPCAVCAISKKEPADVIEAINRAAAKNGRASVSDPANDGTRPADLVAALNEFGFDAYHPKKDIKMGPQNIHTPQINDEDWDKFPFVHEFVKDNKSNELLLGQAYRKVNGVLEAHTIVVKGNELFDNNSGGRLVGPDEIDQQVKTFRVTNTFRIRKR